MSERNCVMCFKTHASRIEDHREIKLEKHRNPID